MSEKERCLMQSVVTVEKIARSHSNQKKTDLSIVMIVSKIIDLHQKAVAGLVTVQEVSIEAQDLVEEMTDHAKCLMQNVATVEKIARSHSNQKKTDLSIVMIVSKITGKISSTYPKVINIPKIKIQHVIW